MFFDPFGCCDVRASSGGPPRGVDLLHGYLVTLKRWASGWAPSAIWLLATRQIPDQLPRSFLKTVRSR